MKSRKNLSIISLLIILSLSLLTSCKTEAPTPTAVESSGETPQAGEAQQQSEDQSASDTPAQTPADTPAQAKPDEPEKPAKTGKSSSTAPKSTAEPETKDDKTSLQIEGSGVEKMIVLTLDELKSMQDAYYEDDFFSLNSYGTKEYFHFKGVKLKAVLEKTGLKKNAKTIKFAASDGYEQELTIEQALKEDYMDEQNTDKKYPIIIAWHENGVDYDAQKGAPFRLVIGQKEPGDVNKPQWVQNVAKIIVD